MEEKYINKILEQQETIKGLQNNQESLIKIMKMYEDYKLRVDKAIEYIKENCYEYDYETYSSLTTDEVIELLKILKGEDKE